MTTAKLKKTFGNTAKKFFHAVKNVIGSTNTKRVTTVNFIANVKAETVDTSAASEKDILLNQILSITRKVLDDKKNDFDAGELIDELELRYCFNDEKAEEAADEIFNTRVRLDVDKVVKLIDIAINYEFSAKQIIAFYTALELVEDGKVDIDRLIECISDDDFNFYEDVSDTYELGEKLFEEHVTVTDYEVLCALECVVDLEELGKAYCGNADCVFGDYGFVELF